MERERPLYVYICIYTFSDGIGEGPSHVEGQQQQEVVHSAVKHSLSFPTKVAYVQSLQKKERKVD